jgi:hypothetical protein
MAGVDPRLSALVQRGLAKEREQRPASFLELGQELAAWLVEQGVQADASGVSLETKWLERGSDASTSTRLEAGRTPLPEPEQATLVSVVHPRLRRSSLVPTLATGRSRRRRWAGGSVVGAALVVGLGWFSLRALRDVGPATQPPPSTATAPTWPTTRVAAAAPAVPIEALPQEPLMTPAPRVSRAAPSTARATPSPRSHPLKRAQRVAPLPGLPLRDPASDLLEPY